MTCIKYQHLFYAWQWMFSIYTITARTLVSNSVAFVYFCVCVCVRVCTNIDVQINVYNKCINCLIFYEQFWKFSKIWYLQLKNNLKYLIFHLKLNYIYFLSCKTLKVIIISLCNKNILSFVKFLKENIKNTGKFIKYLFLILLSIIIIDTSNLRFTTLIFTNSNTNTLFCWKSQNY